MPSIEDAATKTSAQYGHIVLNVSPELHQLLAKYAKYVRPILTRGTPQFEMKSENVLWVTQKGYPLTPKAVCDVIGRTIICGDFGNAVTSRSIRSTLATVGEMVRLNNLSHPAHSSVTTALCFGLRHSLSVHNSIYVQNNRVLKSVRTSKFVSKLVKNEPITSEDISSLSDSNICKSVLPTFNQAQDNSVMLSTSMPTPRGYDAKSGKKHIYHLIQELFGGVFSQNADISSKGLKSRLTENPHLHRDIKSLLGLQNFNNVKKLQSRCKTFQKFLSRKNGNF